MGYRMKKHISYLPASARRYSVSKDGKVYDYRDSLLRTAIGENGKEVEIEWVNGKRHYSIAILVLVTYNGWFIPDHLLDQVVPIYLNNNKNDCSYSNLTYRFEGNSLPVEDLDGFYYIPNFGKYAINKAGELINIETLKYKTWSITPPNETRNTQGGYRYNRVVRDDGVSVTLFRHRALWTAFNAFGSEIYDYVINHKNGICGDDRLENLELVTYLANNIHAVINGLRRDNRVVYSKNIKTGQELKFASLTQCATHFGFTHSSHIVSRITSGKIYSDYLVFKYNEGDWPNYDLENTKISIAKSTNQIMARDVHDGTILVFNGTFEGERLTGVKAGSILSHVKNKTVIPINGWNFRYTHLEQDWPVFNEYHLRIFKAFPIYPSDGLFVTYCENNKKEFFESVSMACQKLKLHKRIIYDHVKTGKSYKSKYLFTLFHLKHLSHPTE